MDSTLVEIVYNTSNVLSGLELHGVDAGLSWLKGESIEFTSVQERILNPSSTRLRPFSELSEETGLPFNLKDYLELVDWAGREILRGKKGFIPVNTPPILSRLNMGSSPVLDFLKRTENFTPVALGSVSHLRCFAQSVGRRFIKGLALGNRLCPESG